MEAWKEKHLQKTGEKERKKESYSNYWLVLLD
jgi:hypothetical protein